MAHALSYSKQAQQCHYKSHIKLMIMYITHLTQSCCIQKGITTHGIVPSTKCRIQSREIDRKTDSVRYASHRVNTPTLRMWGTRRLCRGWAVDSAALDPLKQTIRCASRKVELILLKLIIIYPISSTAAPGFINNFISHNRTIYTFTCRENEKDLLAVLRLSVLVNPR